MLLKALSPTIRYNDFVVSLFVFSNPVELSSVKNTRPALDSDKVDGWIFNSGGLRSLGNSVLPFDPVTLCRNAYAQLLGERTLLPQEENLLKNSKDETRYHR
jgi:hypothetical protein